MTNRAEAGRKPASHTSMSSSEYQFLLESHSKQHWQRITTKKRSGVIAPLFSIYSKKSIGIGEIPDLKIFAEWCKSNSLSIIQLLPMNDVGFEFRPYDACSSFALDPMYLSLEQLVHFEINPFRGQIETLRKKFSASSLRVDYKIKKAKLDLLWTMYQKREKNNPTKFRKFMSANNYWLKDYALFKVIKEIHNNSGWQEWPELLKNRNGEGLQEIEADNAERIEFFQWLQWQLFEQFKDAKQYAGSQGVLILGDLPFLVSRDSADVWAHQNYFKLDLSSGAPPDLYFANGQRWGMPPYQWNEIEKHGYDYLIEKLKYAENFYDMFRIDHFVGLFRLWTIPLTEPEESAGLKGTFDPENQGLWEEHGRKLINVMLNATSMLPCAEDLGIIPECSNRVLAEYGIPGIDVQRWVRDWGNSYDFKQGNQYRKNSVTTISTHDMLPLTGWWINEAGTADALLVERLCKSKGIDFDHIKNQLFNLEASSETRLRWKPEISSVEILLGILGKRWEEAGDIVDVYRSSFDEREKFWQFLAFKNKPSNDYMPLLTKHALQNAQESSSIFSIQLLQDWLSLEDTFPKIDPKDLRINYPGSISDNNWSIKLPFSLEDLKKAKANKAIKDLSLQTGRS